METTIVTLSISNTFEEWAAAFDGSETSAKHSEFGLEPVFRGVLKGDPQQVVVVIKSEPGAVERFLLANELYISSHGAIPETAEVSTWLE